MGLCWIHYDSTEDENLGPLSSIEFWITLLGTINLRNNSDIINVAADLEDREIPKFMYHKTCQVRYTLKMDLNKLRKEVKESSESKRAKSVVHFKLHLMVLKTF